MKQKSNFTFLLSYAKNEKYKLYLSAFLSVCSSILMVVPYILIYNIILELLKTDLDYNRIKHLAIYTAILIVVRLILFILSGVFSHVAAFNILYNIRMQTVKHLGNSCCFIDIFIFLRMENSNIFDYSYNTCYFSSNCYV